MTFDKTGFMTQKRHEAEMALGQPITGDDWETGSVFCPAGNVFEALQDAGKKERHLKVQLAFLIKRAIKALDLTQERVADLTGLSQPDVSRIVRGHLKGFSPFKLVEVLLMLGGHVQLTVEVPKRTVDPEAPTAMGRLSLIAM
jgi:predicted XRE-type DNA-binding protein